MSAALAGRLGTLRRRVDEAAEGAGRNPSSVRLLLATKTVPPEAIAAAVRAGFSLIGENRAQELAAKAEPLRELLPDTPVEVHFIGRLQRNKVTVVVPLVSCVQSVHSAELAGRLATVAADAGRVIDVFVQVNVSGEESKSGVEPAGAAALVEQVRALPALRLRGLMTIGLNSPDAAAVRAGYRRLRELGESVTIPGQPIELSMGMSGDFELAVAEGATLVRLGSAAFGARPPV